MNYLLCYIMVLTIIQLFCPLCLAVHCDNKTNASFQVKKLCCSLRRNAKDERVLFHYNGHGVPKPTAQGEIWVFNRVRILLFFRFCVLVCDYSKLVRILYQPLKRS